MKTPDIAAKYGIDQYEFEIFLRTENKTYDPGFWNITVADENVDAYVKEFKLIQNKREEEQKRKEEEEEQKRKEEEQRQKAEEQRKERERLRKEAHERKLDSLRSRGYEGYYEYTTLSLVDDQGGGLTPDQVSKLLNSYAIDGWKLVTGYANELGHNSTSGGFGGFSTGTNSTVDQHILIMERFIKI